MTDADRAPRRPHVICHMMTSIDGRIVPSRWPNLGDGRREYERVHAAIGADAWMCGRITMEPFAGAMRSESEVARESTGGGERPDFVAPGKGPGYAVAIDPSGRLAWKSNDIDGDHVVAVLSKRVSDEYLQFLRSRGVSYLLTGDRDADLAQALEKLASSFGVRTVMLEGGGKINGSMLRDGLIDELSVLVAPVADGAIGSPALFDVDDSGGAFEPRRLALETVERRADDMLWLRYRVLPPQ
jgi:2,5-diamino-6-(ribosylamino)-4(3H)-pyrimidinone 5'-phosphate reductase